MEKKEFQFLPTVLNSLLKENSRKSSKQLLEGIRGTLAFV
jgi:hypothetical protein